MGLAIAVAVAAAEIVIKPQECRRRFMSSCGGESEGFAKIYILYVWCCYACLGLLVCWLGIRIIRDDVLCICRCFWFL